MTLLSVVVPTHNRADYAISCIAAVLGFDTSNLQLVMTDTSTDRRLYDILHADGCVFLRDPRFVYRKIDEPSNLTKNHNDALALASGDYVCVIGDDDCITGAALEAARWASRRGAKAVSQTVTATYAWPDFRSQMAKGGHAARLYVPRRATKARWRDGDADLDAALTRAFQATDGMPRGYHGIVRRDLLEQVRAETGSYFHGSSPDMSAAVAMACLVGRYCEVDVPLTIPGVSGGSNSGRSAMNTHKGTLSSETQTSGFQDNEWTPGVPRFFAVETVWAHAGLETLRRLRFSDVVRFNYARLLALCQIRHGEFSAEIDRARGEADALLGRSIEADVEHEIRLERWARRKYLLRRMMRPTAANGRRYFGGLPTVADASRRYERYASDTGIALASIIKSLD
jgi:glycosyltransferase involved in cell wall biosynthesis